MKLEYVYDLWVKGDKSPCALYASCESAFRDLLAKHPEQEMYKDVIADDDTFYIVHVTFYGSIGKKRGDYIIQRRKLHY